MKKKKNIFARCLTGVLICAVLSAAVTECFYLPRYLTEKETITAPQTAEGPSVRIISSNVRCFSPTDLGKRSWFYRAPLLMRALAAETPDVIGFQEVTPMHYSYLQKALRGYDSRITYRDKSPLSEGCPIFYNVERFTATDAGTFWLSETPDKMSKSPDAAFNRICSYVTLTENSTGRQLAVLNTHLDHVGDKARIEGIRVILDRILHFGELPIVLMGDFNAGEDSETYREATSYFADAKYLAADTMTGATYHRFGETPDRENIDYFMVSKTGLDVTRYAILRENENGVYPSDHYPILLECEPAQPR